MSAQRGRSETASNMAKPPHPRPLSREGRGEKYKQGGSLENLSPLALRGRGAGGNGTNFVLMKKGPF